MSGYSIIEYFGENNDGKCGYCKKTGNYNSHGFWAHSMSVENYQSLIDRNWRRSGQYCYKPNNQNTCCIMYTIKCDASNFKLSRSHKKILKKVNRFLRDGTKEKNRSKQSEPQTAMSNEPVPTKKHTRLNMQELSSLKKKDVGDQNKSITTPSMSIDAETHDQGKVVVTHPKAVSRPMKKKFIRLEKKKAKLAAKGLTLADVPRRNKSIQKTLEDRLGEEPNGGMHRLQVCMKLVLIMLASRAY